MTALTSDWSYTDNVLVKEKYTLSVMKSTVTEVVIKGFSNYGSAGSSLPQNAPPPGRGAYLHHHFSWASHPQVGVFNMPNPY